MQIEETNKPVTTCLETAPEEQMLKPSYEELKSSLQNANAEIEKLKDEISSLKISEDTLKDEEKLLYFTGFPKLIIFQSIFAEIEPYLSERTTAIPKFQQFLLTLIKLRLNFDFTYLGMLFQCHRTTAARIFENVIDIIYCRFKKFIFWPSRDILSNNMPKCFSEIYENNVTVIIDCFEVLIEQPSNLEAAAKTWSDYKHNQTMKFLIGVSPQGFIMFISNAYGGRASDKFIVEDSNFLENLNPGDLIIADRGFSIDDSVKLYCAQVKYPSFLKGKKQLSPEDLESTRKLASVRIHIERIIRQLKAKFKIFKTAFPIRQLKKNYDEIAFIDKIINVCCCFINLCPPIIPID